MARLLKSVFTPQIGLELKIKHEDGSIDYKRLDQDTVLENLRYNDDGDIETISGRFANVTCKVTSKSKRVYNSITKLRSYFKYDVTPVKMIVDQSEVQKSILVEVPVSEILEDEGVQNVKKIETSAFYGFAGVTKLSDGTKNEFKVKEGDVIGTVTTLKAGEDGGTVSYSNVKLVAVDYDKSTFAPKTLYFNNVGKTLSIPAIALVNVDEVSAPLEVGASLASAVAGVADGGTITLSEGSFNEAITLTKNVTISGAKAGVSAFVKGRDRNNFIGETVLGGAITVDPAATIDVTLDGLVLTEAAYIKLNKAASLTLKNCIVNKLRPAVSNTYTVMTAASVPIRFDVSGNYFGNPVGNVGRIKNTFELNCAVADGSYFGHNYFTVKSGSNNCLCFYEHAAGTITVEENTWEESHNAIRIAGRNAAGKNTTYNFKNNTYLKVANDGYDGFILFQTYGVIETDFSSTTVNLDGTINKSNVPRLYYLYHGSHDYYIKKTWMPKVFINGVEDDPSQYYMDEKGDTPEE